MKSPTEISSPFYHEATEAWEHKHTGGPCKGRYRTLVLSLCWWWWVFADAGGLPFSHDAKEKEGALAQSGREMVLFGSLEP